MNQIVCLVVFYEFVFNICQFVICEDSGEVNGVFVYVGEIVVLGKVFYMLYFEVIRLVFE